MSACSARPKNGYYNAQMTPGQLPPPSRKVGVPLSERWTPNPGRSARRLSDSVSRDGLYGTPAPAAPPAPCQASRNTAKYKRSCCRRRRLAELPCERGKPGLRRSIRRGYSNAGFPISTSSVFEPGAVLSGVLCVDLRGGRTHDADGWPPDARRVDLLQRRGGWSRQCVSTCSPSFTITALDYNTYGFELNARLLLGGGWSTYGGIGYVETEFVDVPLDDISGAENGNELPECRTGRA